MQGVRTAATLLPTGIPGRIDATHFRFSERDHSLFSFFFLRPGEQDEPLSTLISQVFV